MCGACGPAIFHVHFAAKTALLLRPMLSGQTLAVGGSLRLALSLFVCIYAGLLCMAIVHDCRRQSRRRIRSWRPAPRSRVSGRRCCWPPAWSLENSCAGSW